MKMHKIMRMKKTTEYLRVSSIIAVTMLE